MKDTAPYLHDDLAKTLEELVDHYEFFFKEIPDLNFELSEQDKKDIVEYMKLL